MAEDDRGLNPSEGAQDPNKQQIERLKAQIKQRKEVEKDDTTELEERLKFLEDQERQQPEK